MMEELEFLKRVFGLYHRLDNTPPYWDGAGSEVWINANDLFSWGCSDAVEVTPENLPLLEATGAELEALGDVPAPCYHSVTGALSYMDLPASCWLDDVFCARVRQERPQGAQYKRYPEAIKALLNACGPAKAIDLGNPYTEANEYAYGPPEKSPHAVVKRVP